MPLKENAGVDGELPQSQVIAEIIIDQKQARILRLAPEDISDRDLLEHSRNLAHVNAAPRKDIRLATLRQKIRERIIHSPLAPMAGMIYPDLSEGEHQEMYSRRGTPEHGDQGSFTRRMSAGRVFGIELDGRIASILAYDEMGTTRDGRPVLSLCKASTLDEYKGKKLHPELQKYVLPFAAAQQKKPPVWYGSSVNPRVLESYDKNGWHVVEMDADIEPVQIAYQRDKKYIDENMIPQGYKAFYMDPNVDTKDKDTSRINLGIDWDSLDKRSLIESLRHYDNAEEVYPKVPGNKHDTFVIHTAELNTHSGEKLQIEVYKVISTYNGITLDELQIGITRPRIDKADRYNHYVASFDFLRHKQGQAEEWDMKHRETAAVYRNQGIAGEVIDIAEEIFKQRSAENHLEQTMSAMSGQRALTAWLEKRNFVGASEQDNEKLQRLKSQDSGLKEVSMNEEVYTFDVDEFKTKFENLSGPEDPAVWNGENYAQPFFYMKSCFKIKLKKPLF